MSTCPEKDIHSIYVDGELPENYIKQYESHLSSCEKCRNIVANYKKLSQQLNNIVIANSLTPSLLDNSFEKLQTKLKYSKNTKFTNRIEFSETKKWITSFATAAAVFALVFTPIHNKNKIAVPTQINAISRTSMKPISENKVVIDGDLESLAIASIIGKKTEISAQESEKQSMEQNNQKVISATNLVSAGNSNIISNLNSVDIFCPDFSKKTLPKRDKNVENY